MKKRFTLLTVATLSLLCLFLGSCDKGDAIEEPESGYFNDRPMASDEVVTIPTAIIGDIPSDIGAALNIRFTNQTVQIVPSSTQVIIFHISSLRTLDEEAFLEVYHNDGIIIVLDPDLQLLSAWLEELELRHLPYSEPFLNASEPPHELYAFNQSNKHYFLDYIHSDFDHNDFLNSLVSWVNEYGEESVTPPQNISPYDVTQLFNYQSVAYTFNLYLEKVEAESKKKQELIGGGQIDVKFTVYPLYAFQDQASNGDYYIVSMVVTAHNQSMYRGKWYVETDANKHTGYYLCGYYMENLGVKTEILNSNQTVVSEASFASFGTPTPITTIGSVTYTHGLSWSLNYTCTGNPVEGTVSGTYSGLLEYSNTQTKIINDVDTENNWIGSTVDYGYKFNNLPSYKADQTIPITDPPPISINNAEFHQDWIWRVSSTTDNGQEQFVLKNAITPVYGSCYDDNVGLGRGVVRNHWSDAVVGSPSFTVALTPPNRTPTGELNIINSMQPGTFITDVKIWKSTSSTADTPDYTVPRSYASGATVKTNLPVGNYWVEFKAGPDAISLSSYHLSNPVKIERAATTTLNSGFEFEWGGY